MLYACSIWGGIYVTAHRLWLHFLIKNFWRRRRRYYHWTPAVDSFIQDCVFRTLFPDLKQPGWNIWALIIISENAFSLFSPFAKSVCLRGRAVHGNCNERSFVRVVCFMNFVVEKQNKQIMKVKNVESRKHIIITRENPYCMASLFKSCSIIITCVALHHCCQVWPKCQIAR